MVSIIIQAVALVLTNLLFVVPAYSAYQKGLLYESSIYSVIVVISGWYHYTDTLGGCIIAIDNHCYGGYDVMHFIDHYFSCVIITTSAFLVAHPITADVPAAKRRFNRTLKAYSNTILGVLIMFLFLEHVDENYIIAMEALLSLIYMMVAVYIVKVPISLSTLDLLLASCFLVFGVSMYELDIVYKDYYWILHSLWHISLGISLAMFAESKRDLAALFRYLCRIWWRRPKELTYEYAVIQRDPALTASV